MIPYQQFIQDPGQYPIGKHGWPEYIGWVTDQGSYIDITGFELTAKVTDKEADYFIYAGQWFLRVIKNPFRY